jgi:hypothetical protein
MPTAKFGRKDEAATEFRQSDDLIAVRTRSKRSLFAGPVPPAAAAELHDTQKVLAFPDAGVEVYRVPPGPSSRSLEDWKAALRLDPDVRFAGGVLVDDQSGEPVLYTENLFIKFVDQADPDDCRQVLREAGLMIKKELLYATNAFFVAAPEGTGTKVFDIALSLLNRDDVEYCHPEVVRRRGFRTIDAHQWHLDTTTVNGVLIKASANVAAAHQITQGEGITIAIIDDGVDIDHPEFASSGKVLAPRAKLLPIRLSSRLGSQEEADAFHWAADHGADVISCSWGPEDGAWFNPNDPLHNSAVPLPASTRLAIDYATERGRGGKGCVVLFAAGNGNESVDNDGYASYERGRLQDGDAQGNFTNSFGGTSSAAPGAAGVAALVLSVNPDLRWQEVRDILRRACDRIDPQGGAYDGNGHSQFYGYGRLNAETAVKLARPTPRNLELTFPPQVPRHEGDGDVARPEYPR